MKLVLHIGAHFTEEERIAKCLLRNQGDFAKRGVYVPGPSKYRGLLRETLNAMGKTAASDDARDVLMDAILEDAPAERVILCDPNFMRPAAVALQQGQLYTAAPIRMMRMAQLFPEDELEIYLSIRNPASFLPKIHSRANSHAAGTLWGARRPQDVRWSETVVKLREAVPEAKIKIWCSEDAPLLWAYLLRDMAGIPQNEKIIGGFDLLSSIMSQDGMQRFRDYLKKHPNMNETQKRRVIAAFLDKFALDDEIEEELNMPGWSDELVEELSEIYDDDVEAISHIPGITLIEP
ncbi:MAG: hypothetical protein ACSHWZ_17490 [Sulfitobacter sp.]